MGYVAAALASVIWTPTYCPALRIPGIGDLQQIAKSDCERKSISCNEGVIRCKPKIYLWQTSASQKNFPSFIFNEIIVKIKKNKLFVILSSDLTLYRGILFFSRNPSQQDKRVLNFKSSPVHEYTYL